MLTVKTPKLHTLKLKLSLTSISTIFLVCSLFLNSTLHSSCFTQTIFWWPLKTTFIQQKNRCFTDKISLPITFRTSLFKPPNLSKNKKRQVFGKFFPHSKFQSYNVNPYRIRSTAYEIFQSSRNSQASKAEKIEVSEVFKGNLKVNQSNLRQFSKIQSL